MFVKILKKLAGVIIILIGIFFTVSSLKMIFVDTPKTKAALKDAVYVGEDAITPENDGKIVIVCGAFELTEPSYDDELGLSIDSIRISRAKQTMKRSKRSIALFWKRLRCAAGKMLLCWQTDRCAALQKKAHWPLRRLPC